MEALEREPTLAFTRNYGALEVGGQFGVFLALDKVNHNNKEVPI
jgi:hypothetical protein